LISHREVHDVDLRRIVWFAGGLMAAVAVISVVLWWVLQLWTGRTLEPQFQVSPVIATPPPAPGPGLESNPSAALSAMLDAEFERLTTYGWVDREAGTVRIPVERAMQLLVEQGLPAREGAPPDFGLGPAYQLDSSGGRGAPEEVTR
jgi:hypothetical protein